MGLKPQDVVVVLKLCAHPAPRPGLLRLAFELGMSASEIHAAIKRAQASGLLHMPTASAVRLVPSKKSRSERIEPLRRVAAAQRGGPKASAVLEFLVHGLKYVFPARRGEMTRGIPTSYAAAPLKYVIARGNREPIPVWPYPEGTVRGAALEPLYRSVPYAALQDPALYELLAIADALREGRARERKAAEEELRLRLSRLHVND